MSDAGRKNTLAYALIVAVVALSTFAPALRHEFLDWDDQYFLTANPTYNPPTLDGVMRYWITPLRSLYEPVPFTIWGIVAAVSGMKAPVFHALNLLAHVVASVLVFAILRHVLSNKLPALCGALLFAVHPLQAEAVNWASSFHTVLSGMFVMLSLWLYLLSTESRHQAMPLAATAAFVLAILSKPSAVVAPLLAAMLLMRSGRTMWLVLWLILATPIILIAHLSQPAAYVFDVPIHFRPIVALDTIAFDLGKLLWPVRLMIDYGRSPRWLLNSSQVRWTWAIPILLAATAFIFRKRSACPARALGIFAIGLLPALGLTKFEFQHYSTAADRYVYIAMLGPALLAACLVRRWPRVMLPVFALALPVLVVDSFHQSSYWRGTRSLMNRAIAINPRSRIANRVLGYLAARDGHTDEAMDRYERVLAEDPNDAYTNFNVGNLLLAQGGFADAVHHYELATRIDSNNPLIRQNYGVALMRLGKANEAHEQFVAAVRIAPNSADAHANLGSFYLSVDEPALAEREFAEALRLAPDNATAVRGMAKLHPNR